MDKKKFRDSSLDTLPGKSESTAEGKFRDARADQLMGQKISAMDELDTKTKFGRKSGLDIRHLITDKGPGWKKHDIKGATFLGDASKVEEHIQGSADEEQRPDEKKKRFKTLAKMVRELGKITGE